MRKKITVTQKHIDRGIRGNACECPVALALENGVRRASVDLSEIKIFAKQPPIISRYPFPTPYRTFPTPYRTFPTPRSVRRFIEKFDESKPVKPFSFFLDVPEVA